MDITPMCSSPRLIAACHVLLRLLMPRHSPCALYSLTWRRTKCALWFSQELCRPQIWFIVVFVLPYFKVHKLKLCYLSVACSQFLACFTVQFSRCSSNLLQGQIEMLRRLPKHFNPISIGGGYRIRTGDPLLAKQVLYQLS